MFLIVELIVPRQFGATAVSYRFVAKRMGATTVECAPSTNNSDYLEIIACRRRLIGTASVGRGFRQPGNRSYEH
jgi:hypothetical protein